MCMKQYTYPHLSTYSSRQIVSHTVTLLLPWRANERASERASSPNSPPVKPNHTTTHTLSCHIFAEHTRNPLLDSPHPVCQSKHHGRASANQTPLPRAEPWTPGPPRATHHIKTLLTGYKESQTVKSHSVLYTEGSHRGRSGREGRMYIYVRMYRPE